MHKTTVYSMYLYNTTTTAQFLPSQVKFSLLQAILQQHAIVILWVENTIKQWLQNSLWIFIFKTLFECLL